MTTPQKTILVAGHICLDIIPSLDGLSGGLMSIMVPGKLFTLPPAVISTGGAVPNTGCALHKLGVKTKLVGKIGNDTFGHAVKDLLQQIHPTLTENLIIAQNDITAHAITLSVPGTDRIFLCCPGANDNFCENDLSDEMLVDTDVLHFGYPPLVKRMYEDDGRHLENMLARAKAAGVTVSMDMSKPDPDSEAGKVNWRSLLKRVLPYVDIFLPSMDEIAFMLMPDETEKLQHAINQIDICKTDTQMLDEISSELLEMGSGIVAIKMGSGGLYLRTTSDLQRLSQMGRGTPAIPELWADRQLLSPCFEVNVAGTTGAGDSTIAGFLAAFVRDMSPEQTMTHAVGVGACCVERHDAFSGIPTWEQVEKRIGSGWSKRKSQVITSGWEWNENYSLWEGPANSVKNSGKKMIKLSEVKKHQATAAGILADAGISITEHERENIEIVEHGLGEFEKTGLMLVTYINTEYYCAKELIMLPGQTCPEHRHPAVDGNHGKMETFRCRRGIVYLYVPGNPVKHPKAIVPVGSEKYYTVFYEVILKPGEQYTIPENTFHWFQAGSEGAIVSEFSSTSRDESDIFSDPRIKRMPEIIQD